MRRKIIKLGNGSGIISLPKIWINKMGLKFGDEIEINEIGGKLIISSDFKKNEKLIKTIKISKENIVDLKPILTHLYRIGYDIIKIDFQNDRLFKEMESIVSDLLLGFEISEKLNNKIVIENISESSLEAYDIMFRKIFFTIQEIQSLLISSFENNDFSSIEKIKRLKNNVDKITLFCKRLINREINKKNRLLDWELLTFLMHISHSYYYMYEYAINNKIKITSSEKEIIQKLGQYFELFNEAYFKRKINNIHKINNLKKNYQFGLCLDLISKSSHQNAILHLYIREVFRLIQIATSPILSILLSENYE